MSQQSALKLLKKKKKWMTSEEISGDLSLTSANCSLKKLYEQGEILRRQITIKGWLKCYQYKIK